LERERPQLTQHANTVAERRRGMIFSAKGEGVKGGERKRQQRTKSSSTEVVLYREEGKSNGRRTLMEKCGGGGQVKRGGSIPGLMKAAAREED